MSFLYLFVFVYTCAFDDMGAAKPGQSSKLLRAYLSLLYLYFFIFVFVFVFVNIHVYLKTWAPPDLNSRRSIGGCADQPDQPV